MSDNEKETPNQAPDNSNSNPGQGPGKSKMPLPKKPFKPRFTIYWVWGIILVVLIVLSTVNSMNFSTQEITFSYFQDNLLNHNYVDRILVVNKDVAEIFIKTDDLKQPEFAKLTLPKTPPQFKINLIDCNDFL